MPKALSFKGDPKPKKRKRTHDTDPSGLDPRDPASKAQNTGDDGAADETSDTAWTTADQVLDLSGPTLLVLPASPTDKREQDVDLDDAVQDQTQQDPDDADKAIKTVCVATDAGGKVFASHVENMVEGAPGSAEPHDVRQVWVARRVDGDKVCFKGFHGRYLGADKYGIPSATREAISAEETFTLVPCSSSTSSGSTPRFRLKTCWNTYLGRQANKSGALVRADFDAPAEPTDKSESETMVNPSFDPASEIILRIQQKNKTRAPQSAEARREADKVSRAQIRADLGRKGDKLDEDDIKALKRAAKQGRYHEALLDYRAKGAHDKFA